MADHNQRSRLEEMRRRAEAAAAELHQMRGPLRAELERTKELARANRGLSAGVKQQLNVALDMQRQLLFAREEERRSVARDLHDQLGQTLTLLHLGLGAVRAAGPLPETALRRLSEVDGIAQQLSREVSELTTRLRPVVLDELGLLPAIDQLVADWSSRTGIGAELEPQLAPSERLPFEVETTLYRVVQEALTNVARHARAKHVSVILQCVAGQAIACIEDDGVGFDPEKTPKGRNGILGMRERLRLASGSLEIESDVGRGATVIARVPLAPYLESA